MQGLRARLSRIQGLYAQGYVTHSLSLYRSLILLLLMGGALLAAGMIGGNDAATVSEGQAGLETCRGWPTDRQLEVRLLPLRLAQDKEPHDDSDTTFYCMVAAEGQVDAPLRQTQDVTRGFAYQAAIMAASAEAERASLQGVWQGTALGYGQPDLSAVPGTQEARFLDGYRDAGGRPEWEAIFVNVVIPCESGWNLYAVSPGGHRGLAQFHPDTWQRAGGGDWTSAYQQGANVARWSELSLPWGSGGWACWPGGPP